MNTSAMAMAERVRGDDGGTPRQGVGSDVDRPHLTPDRSLRAGLAAAAASMTLLGWWVLRAPFVGLADNGDWGRYSCPNGLHGRVQFARLPATLVGEACPAYDYRSTFTGFLGLFARVDTAVSGAVHLSHLAVFWCLVVSVGWGWFTYELARATSRPGRALAMSVAMIAVSSDVIFSSYFGSIYAEALIIALVPALAAALVRLVRSDRLDAPTVAVAALLLVAVTDAKPSMALTAPLFVGVVVVARWGRLASRQVAIAAVFALALSLFSFTAIADPTFTEWNTYNLAFTVVLPHADDPVAALEDMGVDRPQAQELERFVGVPFGPEVTEAWDDPPLTAFREAGRPAVVEALATSPSTWAAMVHRGGTTLGHLQLDYLANHVGPTGPGGTPRIADRPHPADVVLGGAAWLWWLLPLAWVGLGLWFGRRLRTSAPGARLDAAPAALGLLAVSVAATQLLLALGDGYYELAKHLAVAGHVTAVTITGLAVAGVAEAVDRLRAG